MLDKSYNEDMIDRRLMCENAHLTSAIPSSKVLDLHLNDFTVEQLLPGVQIEILIGESGGFDSRTYDPESGKVSLSVHTWVVRREGKIFLLASDRLFANKPCMEVIEQRTKLLTARILALQRKDRNP